MKAYGQPSFVENPDVGDIKGEARKSSVGRFLELGGDYKGYHRSSKKKRAIRRLQKQRARRQGRQECRDGLADHNHNSK